MSAPREEFLNGKVALHCGDCMEVVKTLADDFIDSVVTDPPYALVSIVKRFGKTSQDDDTQTSEVARTAANSYARLSKGFMGRSWDNGATAFAIEFWREILRVVKPGGHVVAFSGTRTYHRLAVAIEDAGFEIRDMVGWLYGTGFPKSHNLHGEWQGWGTALKPAQEPICLARKPLSEGTVATNVLEWGTGALNIDGTRIASGESTTRVNSAEMGFHGGNLASSYQTGSLLGRWPANICHDGSAEVVAMFPDDCGGGSTTPRSPRREGSGWDRPANLDHHDSKQTYDGQGSAARFFFSAKADQDDRLGSKHPTVKPVDLMQWLCRLVTPPRGVVLDPFSGTGTTGEAAFREGFSAVLIEREAEYQADIRRRMSLCLAGPDERAREALKANGRANMDPGPLFSPVASRSKSVPETALEQQGRG